MPYIAQISISYMVHSSFVMEGKRVKVPLYQVSELEYFILSEDPGGDEVGVVRVRHHPLCLEPPLPTTHLHHHQATALHLRLHSTPLHLRLSLTALHLRLHRTPLHLRLSLTALHFRLHHTPLHLCLSLTALHLHHHSTTTQEIQGEISRTPVLAELKFMSPLHNLSLKDLTLKLVMLMALTHAARVQTLHLLILTDISVAQSYITLRLRGTLKQARPGFNVCEVQFKAYSQDASLCVCATLRHYLERTEFVNGDHWNVGYSPSGEAQKDRLLGTHRQAPTGSPRVDKIKPTLK
ncbi:uncharacterized protein LOC123513277 [Portunus trituberculatus]|uniref:uncharacterized protein LOC123513277 n=1 Tax=Portunus trituberculatus TaxID=210409 RepID=UPI001E1CE4EB|nr:uncharacterized protein LOC123513277 [Portunus trituberculatus]